MSTSSTTGAERGESDLDGVQRDLTPELSEGVSDAQFHAVAASLTNEQKMEFLLKTVAMNKTRSRTSPDVGYERGRVAFDARELAGALTEGLKGVVGSRDSNGELDRIKRNDAQDIYELCSWLMRAEASYVDVDKRMRAAQSRGNEIVDIARVRTEVSESALQGQEKWKHFIRLVCEVVNPEYLAEIPENINNPERVSNVSKAKQTVSRRFGVFVWLSNYFPEMKLAAGVGDPAKGQMLLKSVPEDIQMDVTDHLAVLPVAERSFSTVSRLVESKSKRRRTTEDVVANTPRRALIAAQRGAVKPRPRQTTWPVNAVEEEEDSGPRGTQEDSCQLCGFEGHTAQDCNMVEITALAQQQPGMSTIKCYNCGGTGHMARNCEKPRDPTRGVTSTRSCYTCGKTGHMSAQCPENPRRREPQTPSPMRRSRGGDDTRRCYNCGQMGHLSRNCPSKAPIPPGPPDYPPPGLLNNRGSLNR